MLDTCSLNNVDFSHSSIVFGVLAYTLQNVYKRAVIFSDSRFHLLCCFFIRHYGWHYLRCNIYHCRGGRSIVGIEVRYSKFVYLTWRKTVVRTSFSMRAMWTHLLLHCKLFLKQGRLRLRLLGTFRKLRLFLRVFSLLRHLNDLIGLMKLDHIILQSSKEFEDQLHGFILVFTVLLTKYFELLGRL